MVVPLEFVFEVREGLMRRRWLADDLSLFEVAPEMLCYPSAETVLDACGGLACCEMMLANSDLIYLGVTPCLMGKDGTGPFWSKIEL